MMKLTPVRAGLLSVLLFAATAEAATGVKVLKVAPSTDSLRLRYAISLIGLPLGTASVSGTLGSGQYRIEANAKLTGLAGVIVNSKGAATATGAIGGEHQVPATFAASAATSNYMQTIRMAMAKGAATGVEITPPYLNLPDRVPVTDADRRNILDPLSAFIMPVPGTGDIIGPAACNRTLNLFDGGVRFDIVLSYSGTRQVKTPGYSGPVAICSARYRPIAGHRPNRPATKFMIDNKEMEVWLAPLGATRYVIPYRISVLTMIGTTVVEATDIQISAGTPAAGTPAAGTTQ